MPENLRERLRRSWRLVRFCLDGGPAGVHASAARRERLRQIVITWLLLEIVGSAYAFTYFSYGLYLLSFITAGAMLVTTLGPYLALRTGKILLPAHLTSLALFTVVVTTTWASGGLAEPGYAWVYVIPLVAGLLGGTAALVPWSILAAAATVAMNFGGLPGFPVMMVIPGELAVAARAADIIFIFATILLTMGGFFRTRALAEREADAALRTLAEQVDTRRRAEEAARNADRAKSAFLATMSHELRTPMNGVLGMSELMLEMPLGDQQRRCAEVIKSSGEALMALLNDILDYSKIEAGKMDFESVSFDVRDLVENLAQLIAGRAQERGLELLVDIEPTVPATATGDPARLRQVLLNLLSNAVKFTSRGEIEVRVDAGPRTGNRQTLLFSIRDTGIGIEPSALPRLFEPFTQADSGVARRFGGSGLGLAICRRILEQMGGDVTVQSRVGEGSTFNVVLPLPVGDPTPDRGGCLLHWRVLVVEPHPRQRETLVRQISWLGAQCVACDDVLIAAVTAAQPGSRFDVALINRQIGGEDGLLFAATLARNYPSMRVIPLVEWGAFLSDETLGELGFATQLARPASSRVICDAIVGGRRAPVAEIVRLEEVDGDGPLILVADDNVVNRRVATLHLRRLGYQVIEAEHGQEALDRIARSTPAAVLMDIEMPVMDGYEATRQLRARNDRLALIPVIALTAHAMSGYRETVLQAGMDDYLTKPLRRDQLAAALSRVLARREVGAGELLDAAR